MDGAGSSVHWHQRRKTSDTHQIPRLCLGWTNAGKKGHKEPARGGQAALYWPAAPTGGAVWPSGSGMRCPQPNRGLEAKQPGRQSA